MATTVEDIRKAWWLGLLALLLPWSGALALDRDRSLEQFHHTGWTLKDGVPPDIWALAQTPDGFLWLGTGAGLFRFDGVHFEQSALPLRSSNITALYAGPGGDLWIGYYFGGASRLSEGQLSQYDPGQGIPAGVVFDFARTGDGAVWAATSLGLGRWQNGQWRAVGADQGYPAGGANWLLVDNRGVLWVSTGETVLFLRPGATAFEPTGERTGVAVLAQAPDGRIWVSDDLNGTRVLPDYPGGHPPASGAASRQSWPVQAKRLLFDRDGGLWATDTARGGVFRLSYPERFDGRHSLRADEIFDVYRHQQGLTADIAVPILEDREGTIWIGTNLGLNRFRRNPFIAEPRLPDTAPFGFALAPGDDDGAMWVAYGNVLSSVEQGTVRSSTLPLPRISCIYRAWDGALWLGGPGTLGRWSGGQLAAVAVPPLVRGGLVQAMAQDSSGALWVSFAGRGVFRLAGGAWSIDPRLPPEPALAMTVDAARRVWFGYSGSRAAVLDAAGVRLLGPEQGLDIGNIMSMTDTPHGLLAGGELGLARYEGSGFRSITARRAEAFGGISGMVETANGDLWLNGIHGVARIGQAELGRALAEPAFHPRLQLFNYEDGLPGVGQQASPVPTAAAAGDGRLWFATNHGVAWTDPARIVSNEVPPPVAILGISAGGARYAATDGVRLPQRTTSLEIDYTGLSLAVPERVRFRYRLEEPGGEWQDAGTRREAIYTNLGAGRHRFRVIAANNDGVWNDTGAAMDFVIEPTFVQTLWFKILCGAMIFFALWLIYLLRLRQMTLRLRARLEERYDERERIARELHDTLLQGVQGLILRFHALAQRIPEPEVRCMIEQSLDHADAVLEQGRDRVRALRDLARPVDDLAEGLAAFGRECSEIHDIQFKVQQQHRARPLNPIVRDEIFQIAREALFNAFQHSAAVHIEVDISYGGDALRVRVRDDGRGIDPAILQAGGRAGHWGLSGMRERARKIKARLDIWSRTGLGTEIDLRVPAELAYCGFASTTWWKRLLGQAAAEDLIP